MIPHVVNETTPEIFLLPPNCQHQQWCRDLYGFVDYVPSLTGNAALLAFFGIALLMQLFLGMRYRAWSFTVPMAVGIILEMVGYGGRLGMHYNVFERDWFTMYLCCITIGPAFFSAAVYLCISRIITIYGRALSLLAPRTITLFFVACDFLSLLQQAVGGALVSTAQVTTDRDNAFHIMVSGMSTQVAATTSFALLCLHLMWAVQRQPEKMETKDAKLVALRETRRFKCWLVAVGLAVVTILVRCIFRLAELSEGFKGELANNEALFLVLDSAMMMVCVSVLTAAHPGLVLNGTWAMGQACVWEKRKSNAPGQDHEEREELDVTREVRSSEKGPVQSAASLESVSPGEYHDGNV